MAIHDDTRAQEARNLNDLVHRKATQLHALLACTYGHEEDEGFRNMSSDLQDKYLWACADMAKEIVTSLDKLMDLKADQPNGVGVSHG